MTSVKCPTCRAEAAWKNNPHRPFCSERCRLIDLGAWIEGRYRIPGDESETDQDEIDDEDEEEPYN